MLIQIETGAGYEIYKQESCITFHGDNLEGASGPELTDHPWSAGEIDEIISNGIEFNWLHGSSKMDEEDQIILAEWLNEQ
ncbi:c-type cytochrome [Shouchella patagoniensis]|uniref:c-type cytochrome n=1 Tax=Shouchella patagoniensis TaxID=228576 RepID=UPI0009951FAA|nr:cytochrome c [Shouchella patagoniensis]